MSSGGGGKRRGLAKSAAHVGPNMTPMVDIVMCILIFFMLSMTFAGAEVFLTSNMVVSDKGLGQAKDVIDIPPVRVAIIMQILPDGGTGVRTDNSAFTNFLRVGRPDSAKPENVEAEQALNNAIAGEFRKLHDGGLGDNALVILTPKGFVPYEDLIKVYDACIKASFAKVAFAPAVD